MRVYTKIVINIESGKIVEAEFFEYHGPVAELKGDGGGQSYDPAYNAGMLELSKEQQDWARQMFNQYQYGVTYDPNEKVGDPNSPKILNPEWEKWNQQKQQSSEFGYDPYGTMGTVSKAGPEPEKYIHSKMKTLGEIKGYDPSKVTSEMQYQQNLIEANQSMLGKRTEAESAQLSDVITGIGERAPVRSKFYTEALEGIDIGTRMDEAQASVEHGFKLSGESARREAMSYGGLDPSKIASISTGMNLEKAKAIAGARTAAKTTAEDEQFSRLRSAMTI